MSRSIVGTLPLIAAFALLLGDAFGLALAAKIGFELGEDAKHIEERLAGRVARVDRLLGGFESNAAALQIVDDVTAKLEKRADMYVSTLRRFIEAMGGELEIVARFPDHDVRIKNFRDLEEQEHA